MSSRLLTAGQRSTAADPAVAEFVGWCHLERPLNEYLQGIAAAQNQPPERLAAEFLRIVRRLIEHGILEP